MNNLVGKKKKPFGKRRTHDESAPETRFELSREQGFVDGNYDIFDLLVQRNSLLEEADALLLQTRALLIETEKAILTVGFKPSAPPP